MPIPLISRLTKGARAGARAVREAGGGDELLQQALTGVPTEAANTAAGLNAIVPAGIITGLLGRDLTRPIRESQAENLRGAYRQFMGRPPRTQELYELEQQRILRAQAQRIEQEALQERITRRIAYLAAANPQLYNEVSAGRRLPRGAQVFGGRKRTDLLEQLALRAEG